MVEVVDPDGRTVRLSEERWLHIVDRHEELETLRADVLRTIERPDLRIPGRYGHEEWFYTRHVGPSRWLKVVVHYEGGRGSIHTAFPRRSFP